MTTVTISKIEYKELKQRADSFERLISTQERLARLAPPIRSRNEIIRQMNNTGRYNPLPHRLSRQIQQGSAYERYPARH